MILDDILAQTRQTVAADRARTSIEELANRARASAPPRDFFGALFPKPAPGGKVPRPAVIAEFKRRSPSAGDIAKGADPATVARAYEKAGASALSVLTEPAFFGGSWDDLKAARAATSLPVIRKDFIVDRYQIVETRALGADAILLIVAALTNRELVSFMEEAARWGLDVLVEAHTEEEVHRAIACGARLVGINNRDLKTFHVDTTLSARLRGLVPKGRRVVAESGIKTAADVSVLMHAGVDAILVGETLMRGASPSDALTSLLAVASDS